MSPVLLTDCEVHAQPPCAHLHRSRAPFPRAVHTVYSPDDNDLISLIFIVTS
jgi:hypothetical protein